ncbi:4151_t:CDS:1, partial [Funneliformis geosporum]
ELAVTSLPQRNRYFQSTFEKMGSECEIEIEKPISAIRSFIFSLDLNHVITDHHDSLAI